MKTFIVAQHSDTGDVRPANQDSIYTYTTTLGRKPLGVFAVSDGMGGLAHGALASQSAVCHIAHWTTHTLLPALDQDDTTIPQHLLGQLFTQANQAVWDLTQQQGQACGATLSLLVWYGNQYAIAHLGDSRIYHLRPFHKLTQCTPDHSLVALQVRSGQLTAQEAAHAPNRNVIMQALGLKPTVIPFTCSGKTGKQDLFLLTSDGFHGPAPMDTVTGFLRNNRKTLSTQGPALRQLIPPGTARDNVSVIAVTLGQPSEDVSP